MMKYIEGVAKITPAPFIAPVFKKSPGEFFVKTFIAFKQAYKVSIDV